MTDDVLLLEAGDESTVNFVQTEAGDIAVQRCSCGSLELRIATWENAILITESDGSEVLLDSERPRYEIVCQECGNILSHELQQVESGESAFEAKAELEESIRDVRAALNAKQQGIVDYHFLDEHFELTDQDHAALVEITLDNGQRVFGVPATDDNEEPVKPTNDRRIGNVKVHDMRLWKKS